MESEAPTASTKDSAGASVCDLYCPANHNIKPVTLKFYQGHAHIRECDECKSRIPRDEVRHQCERGEYNLCLRCFERKQLQHAHDQIPVSSVESVSMSGPAAPRHVPEASPSDSEDEVVIETDVARGYFQIPEAVGEDCLFLDVTCASKIQELEKPAPADQFNLCRYICAGDILNYNGANRWGHTVLALAKPQVVSGMGLCDQQGTLVASSVVMFIVKVLQSASNMTDINVSTVPLIVHPDTHEICAVKRARRGFTPILGCDGNPVTLEILQSPFSNQEIDFEAFILAVEDVRNATHSLKWSFRTAVWSYLRHAQLHPERYETRERKLHLASKLEGNWMRRPVCSSVPPRIWQKYLLKCCQRRGLGPDSNGNTNPEIAWVDEVLKLMPVKDDRVLPAELSRILTETKYWQVLDFTRGPRPNRCSDEEPAIADYFNVGHSCQRKALPIDVRNAEGAIVRLGSNNFTIYCGRKVSKLTGEKNGICGPNDGPQCMACRRMEDRLLA